MKLRTRIDVAAERELRRSNWDPRDRALFFEIIYGVVRQHGRLEWLIKRMTTTREKPDPAGVAAAAVGLYQFLFLDRVPEYAIVDSTVEAAKRIAGPLTAGWVNAVLRRASLDKDELLATLPDPLKTGVADRLAVEYSFPAWMVSRWTNALSEDELHKFLIWGNRRPRLTLRANTLKSSVDEITALLLEKGITTAKFEKFPEFISIDHGTDSRWLDEILSGRASAQDVSQGLVARLVNPVQDEEVLDLCSAPGGKTGHLAELAPGAKIIATDKAEERLDLVRELVVRNGYSNVEVVHYDEIVGSKRKFDAVLVDAPCSGTGVLARRPDLRWRRSPDDIRRMAAVQLSLMHYAADKLKPSGRIIYSTCSVEDEENEGVVQRFLEDRRDFEIVPAKTFLPEDAHFQTDMLKLWGTEIDADGVFGVILRKKQR